MADLDDNLADNLADRGVRIDDDVVDDDRAVHGLRPRSGLLTPAQREELHRLAHADEPLGVDEVRALYAIARPDTSYTERHTIIEPEAAVRLQQLELVQCGATVERQCFGATCRRQLKTEQGAAPES